MRQTLIYALGLVGLALALAGCLTDAGAWLIVVGGGCMGFGALTHDHMALEAPRRPDGRARWDSVNRRWIGPAGGDGLDDLKARYLAGDLDTIDYMLAVDAWPPQDAEARYALATPINHGTDAPGGFYNVSGMVEVTARAIERKQRAALPGAVAGPEALERLRDRLHG